MKNPIFVAREQILSRFRIYNFRTWRGCLAFLRWLSKSLLLAIGMFVTVYTFLTIVVSHERPFDHVFADYQRLLTENLNLRNTLANRMAELLKLSPQDLMSGIALDNPTFDLAKLDIKEALIAGLPQIAKNYERNHDTRHKAVAALVLYAILVLETNRDEAVATINRAHALAPQDLGVSYLQLTLRGDEVTAKDIDGLYSLAKKNGESQLAASLGIHLVGARLAEYDYAGANEILDDLRQMELGSNTYGHKIIAEILAFTSAMPIRQFQAAEQAADRLVALSNDTSDKALLSLAYFFKGVISFARTLQIEPGDEFFKKSYIAAVESGNASAITRGIGMYLIAAKAHLDAGHIVKATTIVQEISRGPITAKSAASVGEFRIALGRQYADAQQFAQAEEMYKGCVNLAIQVGDGYRFMECGISLAELLILRDDIKNASMIANPVLNSLSKLKGGEYRLNALIRLSRIYRHIDANKHALLKSLAVQEAIQIGGESLADKVERAFGGPENQ